MAYANKRSRAVVVQGIADWFALYRQIEMSVSVYWGGASATCRLGERGPDERFVLVYMHADRSLTVTVDTGDLMFRTRRGWARSFHMQASKDIAPITGPGWEAATVLEVVRAVHCIEAENMQAAREHAWEQCMEADNGAGGLRNQAIPERRMPW